MTGAIHGYIQKSACKTLVDQAFTLSNNQACTRYYFKFLPDNSGEDHSVCQTFFLHTLGYKNDKIVKCIFKKN